MIQAGSAHHPRSWDAPAGSWPDLQLLSPHPYIAGRFQTFWYESDI